MRILNWVGVLWVLFCAIGFTACNNGDNEPADGPGRVYPLIFEQDSLEIRQGITSRLSPVSSNGVNTLDVLPGDTSLLKAYAVIFENGTSHASGWIDLMGRRKGRTSLTVYDRVAKETAVLDVRITDFYLGMELRSSNHPLFPQQRPGFLFLVNNDTRDFYFFGMKEQRPDGVMLQGSYAFSVENNTPYLTLTTDAVVSYRFDLSRNDQEVYTLLSHFFRLNWESTPAAETKGIDRTMYLYLKEDTTDKEVSFAITDPQLPAGMLE